MLCSLYYHPLVAVSWLDWDGICFSVTSSSDRPFAGATNWIVYPNDFPTQQVEIYYDLPALSYPSEYHTDNSTNGVFSVQAGSAPSCVPTPIFSPLVPSALTYQFCYQAYSAAKDGVPAWQVAIQGTFLTNTSFTPSSISGQCGLFVYSVTGTRTQSVGGTQSSVNIVGQTFHNSGTTIVDKNEFNDDPLLQASAPYLTPGYGFVLYTDTHFTYPNGTAETIDNTFAKVTADPLWVGSLSSSVTEVQGPTPDWSGFAISCGCSVMSCPLITASGSAASSSPADTTCNAVSKSTSALTCSTSSTVNTTASNTCSPNSAAAHITAVGAATLLVALTTVLAIVL